MPPKPMNESVVDAAVHAAPELDASERGSVNVCARSLPAEQIWRQQDIEVYCFGQPRHAGDRRLLSARQIARLFTDANAALLLEGHFAVVIVKPQQQRCWIYADRFASHRLYFCQVKTGSQHHSFWVSDNLQQLKQQQDLYSGAELSQQALVNYLFFHMIPSPETIYKDIYALQPAEQIHWDGAGIRRQRGWTPRFEQTSGQSAPELADELLSLMRELMPDYCQQGRTGCFLSGGLDSSSIAGLVAETLPRTEVFSIGFPIAQYNELDYARTAVKHFGLTGHEYLMSPEDVVAALPQVIASMDQPFGNSSVMPAYFCAKLARSQGIDRLIAGDGGDELFAGNERYASQLKLDRLRTRLGPLIGILDRSLLQIPWPDSPALLGKAKSLTRQLKMS
ncbi:MAG: asparagine synthase (glutamine-hydrolyzing), partial [Motiliproteus sp.]